jgi:hypothetical protein
MNFQQKAPARARRQVWRIDAQAPRGHWVDPATAAAPPPKVEVPEVSSGGWVMSSFDLLHGTDVCEIPDTVPDKLLDELFRPQPEGMKTPRE